MRSDTSPKTRDYILCLVSSVFLVFSFPGFNLWPCAWFGLVPLFFTLKGKTRKQAFLLAYLTGIFFWSGTIYWLIHVTLLGTIILILYLSLYFGLFGLISSYILTTSRWLFSLPSIWVLLEYIRSHALTGFPWALLGYSQYLNLPAIQISDITGIWGVSFAIVLANTVIYAVISNHTPKASRKQRLILASIFLIITFAYGYYRIYCFKTQSPDLKIRVCVIQGNIPQELKWNPRFSEAAISKYINLTRQAANEGADLVIWPEAALPVVLEDDPEYFEKALDLAREINKPLLLGAVTLRHNLLYNSAVLVSAKGEMSERYDKLHLVPFGEYIPLKKIFGFLETIAPIGDIERGKEYVVFQLPLTKSQSSARFSVLICFEDLFPELSREFCKKEAQLLIVITNDAWYKKTAAAEQHLQASVFRAVENRISLARAANTGVSAFITPEGRIISEVNAGPGENIFVDGFKTEDIIITRKQDTFYSRWGDFFVLICFLSTLFPLVARARR